MRIELHLLAASILLGFVHLFVAVVAATQARGVEWNKGNREGNFPPLSGCAFRLDQAFKNFLETFPFFAAAVLMVAHAQRDGTLSVIGAHLYFWARLVYLPVYAAGIQGVRTLVWLISVIGIFGVWLGLYLGV